MLPAVFGLLSPLLPAQLTIILTAVVIYSLSFVISRLIGKLPFGKYIVGWKGYSRSWLTKYASSIARSLVALQDDGMEVFDLWVQSISSSETLCFENEISIWPVSSSNKGLNEDEIKRNDYFPMQTIILIDNQLVTASVVQIWFRKKGVYLVTNRTENWAKKPKTNIAKNLRNRNKGLLQLKGGPLSLYARTYGVDRSQNVPGSFLQYPFVLGCLLLVLV